MKNYTRKNVTLTGSYLYEKDVYDPNADPELTNDGEGYELPDLHQDIEDGIIEVQ